MKDKTKEEVEQLTRKEIELISGVGKTEVSTYNVPSEITLNNNYTIKNTNNEKTIVNKHIKAVYTYNENGTGSGKSYTGCLGGEEAGCKKIDVTSTSSYPVGTIVKYEVAPNVEKYFNVLYDNDNDDNPDNNGTLILQQRENTIYSTPWYDSSDDNSHGPTTVLPVLENATKNWTYVNDQTYQMGTTKFGTGSYKTAYTGAPWEEGGVAIPNANTYTLEERTAKARMITVQEANQMGCMRKMSDESTNMSCKKFMNNYLYESTTYGGTVIDDYYTAGDHNWGYWTMSGISSNVRLAFIISCYGYTYDYSTPAVRASARAVVEINK